MIKSSYLNLFGPVLFSLLTLLIVSSIFLIFKFTFAEPSLNNSYLFNSTSSASIFPIINGTYTIPSEGFQITLPPGWGGIDLNVVALVSPIGIEQKTGTVKPGGDKVLMVLGRSNLSYFLGDMKRYNTSSYRDYIKKTAASVGCDILSDKFVTINTIRSEELTEQCGSQHEEKTISYTFASRKSIIFIGLKGRGLTFDNNLEKFKESVQTIKINNSTDIEDIILGHALVR